MSGRRDDPQFVVVRLPRGAQPSLSEEEVIAAQRDFAELALQTRRKRGRLLATDVLADCAWDMLLDLFVNRVDGKLTSTPSLCARTSAPPSTAMRYVALLERAGLVEQVQPHGDATHPTIGLTQEGFAKIQRLLTA